MIKSLNFKLLHGEFQISEGTEFSITSKNADHLVYENKGVWHIESDPCAGKIGRTIITIPSGYVFDNIQIILDRAILSICKINTTNIGLELRNSTAETDGLTAKYLSIRTARGDIRTNADVSITDIDCGYGTIDLHFKPYTFGYNIHSTCGMGNVTHNSKTLPKKYASASGERKINIICGMGTVNFYT